MDQLVKALLFVLFPPKLNYFVITILARHIFHLQQRFCFLYSYLVLCLRRKRFLSSVALFLMTNCMFLIWYFSLGLFTVCFFGPIKLLSLELCILRLWHESARFFLIERLIPLNISFRLHKTGMVVLMHRTHLSKAVVGRIAELLALNFKSCFEFILILISKLVIIHQTLLDRCVVLLL